MPAPASNASANVNANWALASVTGSASNCRNVDNTAARHGNTLGFDGRFTAGFFAAGTHQT
jgi:hypothetical protein